MWNTQFTHQELVIHVRWSIRSTVIFPDMPACVAQWLTHLTSKWSDRLSKFRTTTARHSLISTLATSVWETQARITLWISIAAIKQRKQVDHVSCKSMEVSPANENCHEAARTQRATKKERMPLVQEVRNGRMRTGTWWLAARHSKCSGKSVGETTDYEKGRARARPMRKPHVGRAGTWQSDTCQQSEKRAKRENAKEKVAMRYWPPTEST